MTNFLKGFLVRILLEISFFENLNVCHVFFFAPKGLFVFAILTDMPLKIDVCASDQK